MRLAALALLLAACAGGSGGPAGQTGTAAPVPQGPVPPAPTTGPLPTAGATRPAATAAVATASPVATTPPAVQVTLQEYPVPAGSGPHDVAPAKDGGVWYTAQRSGRLGWLDPASGRVREVPLGAGSSPHGVIVDADGVAWVTDSGLNAILSVDPRRGDEVKRYPLPATRPNVNLNTATFDRRGVLWFTGQSGYYGSVDPRSGEVKLYDAPRGRGPYGITATPDGAVYYASLAGSHIARIDVATGAATAIEPPTAGQGARRVWSDSKGNVWVSEYSAGQVARFDPRAGAWKEWKLPGARPLAYSVYVDERDAVWLTDFAASAIVRFDPLTETFASFPHAPGGNVRQMLGRPGEAWGALSAHDKLVVIRTR